MRFGPAGVVEGCGLLTFLGRVPDEKGGDGGEETPLLN